MVEVVYVLGGGVISFVVGVGGRGRVSSAVLVSVGCRRTVVSEEMRRWANFYVNVLQRAMFLFSAEKMTHFGGKSRGKDVARCHVG